MRFGLLGPVEVWCEGRRIGIARARERLILAALLLEPGSVVTVGRLVAELWSHPPPTATAQVHNMVSSLRRRLRTAGSTAAVIQSRPGGYVVPADGCQVDVAEFRDLIGRAQTLAARRRYAEAAQLADAALALWRGPALADVTEEFAAGPRRLLDQERRAAAEFRLTVWLRLGRYDDLLRDLQPVLDEHPFRERLHELRMLALVGAGRRIEALEASRSLHRLLADELGVSPGGSVRRLEQAILRGEDVLADDEPAAPPVPRELPPVTSIVAGRAALVTEVTAALRPRTSGPGPVAVLTGPGGVGKTTVALLAAALLDPDYPDGQLLVDLGGAAGPRADPHDVAGRVLRSLGVEGSAVPADRAERLALYRTHLADRRLLVLLDDAAGEGQVRALLPSAPTSCVLVTSRLRLDALLDAYRWVVPVLDPDAAAQLLTTVVGPERTAAEPEAAAAVVELCGRLPLAVRVVAARLVSRPEWTLTGFADRLREQRHRLDELVIGDLDVRAGIAMSYRTLSPAARELLRRTADLPGPSWPAWVADELAGPRAETAVAELTDAHLVERLGLDRAGQHRFRLHALVAAFAAEEAAGDDPDVVRAARTRVLSRWVALAEPADRLATAGEPTAATWFEVERPVLLAAIAGAADALLPDIAGRLALSLKRFLALHSYEEDRETALRRALACPGVADHLAAALLAALFELLNQRNEYAELTGIAEEEQATARRSGDRLAECLALSHAARAARIAGRLDEAADRFAAATALVRTIDAPARLVLGVLGAAAHLHADRGRFDRAAECSAEVVATARAADCDPRIVAIELSQHGAFLTEADRLDEAGTALREALTLTHRLADRRGTAWVENDLANVHLRTGDHDAAEACLRRARRTMDDLKDWRGLALVHQTTADLAFHRRQPDQAVRPLREALALWAQVGGRVERARCLARLARALHATGATAEAATHEATCHHLLTVDSLTPAALHLPTFIPHPHRPPPTATDGPAPPAG